MNETITPELGRFMTIADVAFELKVSANQAYLLVRGGELAAIKVGSSWRVERSVFEQYIADKYEETRRANLWHQIDYSDLAEFTTSR